MRKILFIISFFIFFFISCESKTSENDNESTIDTDLTDADLSEISDQEPDAEHNDTDHEPDPEIDSILDSDSISDSNSESDSISDDSDSDAEEPDEDSDTYYKAPENLSADDGISHNRILVTWDELPNKPKVYIYRSESESGPFENPDNTWTTGNDFSDENIVPGKKYYYKAKADYTIKRSEFSNMDSGFSITDNSEYELAFISGEEGNALGQFKNPTGIEYIDYQLVITDTDNNRVQFLDPENLDSVKQTSLGFSGLYAGTAYSTHSGKILLSTGFYENESFISTVYYTDFDYDPKEAEINELHGFTSSSMIWNIYGEEMSLIHVVDKKSSKIHVFNLTSYNDECFNDYCLHHVKSFGSEGSEDGKLQSPSGATVFDNFDYWSFVYVFVVDSGNNRINAYQMYSGTFEFSFGSSGTGDGEFNNPTDITISEKGYIFVTDSGNNRVQKFSLGGHFITKFGESGNGEGQFNNPAGITTDKDGNVYVVDKGNNRIQKFKPISQ